MEITYLIIGLFAGGLLSAIFLYFFLKSTMVARSLFDDMNNLQIKTNSDLQNAETKINEINGFLITEKENARLQALDFSGLKELYSTITAQFSALQDQYEEQKERYSTQTEKLEEISAENKNIFSTNAELNAVNKSLNHTLENQKSELEKMQEVAKTEFQNLANKIFEEKSLKFTTVHSDQLKLILDPFQEKITELKNRVNETYDKESKERFSLAEKVKELAELNQQISDDAKKLTRALKGESKTQGNWGEMILESILEKSGLVKGREYFLEHELKNEDHQALRSEFSGKKMRPDAVIKYPDERNVIIDSKVSLTAFTEMVDETDAEVYAVKQALHLTSLKNHITDLSRKAYDDYGKSLDFVMLFIPSEPAYIAAMQADPQLWNFAYDRRILLLNPSNLITSLKLIADLWKREYQNKNSLEIAERGAKLYDKFVGFVENLEKVGKNIDLAKSFYTDAYKQLYSGNDNLILQTQKLKNLGIKNKKNLPSGLTERGENSIDNKDD